ncbi:ABC transporter permease [Nocardioides acrostichi]|uniref:ABC transporter permease n=1 Tax=Nocardioides acrostichi TaxID=2784339 RepID=A0A930UZT9_9ACTN|nr:ABC transporter permease [Nocardioides acrostichi]MBF4161132.1 ABC transporter permease [Nocardioides acrostichi]
MSGRLTSWRLALRLARRDARRSWVRSGLVLVLIALPVLAVTAAATLYETHQMTGSEGVDRRLGTAAAKVYTYRHAADVAQTADPETGGASWATRRRATPPTERQVLDTLGGERRAVPIATGYLRYRTAEGMGDAQSVATDFDDPLTAGIATLSSGHWPESDDEVVVSQALLDRDPGEQLTLRGGTKLDIVGTAESTSYRDTAFVFARPGVLPTTGSSGDQAWLVAGGPVVWQQVRQLNDLGAFVVSRAVLADPPSASQLDPDMQYSDAGIDSAELTILVLIVVMVLIEVVLLAGPAFAVGARQQTRTLALIAAAGGTPRQARRVILASGVVLGAAGAVLGVVLGIAAARALQPLVQHFDVQRFGPFDVPWLPLGGVAAFGLVSALLAAVVPAFIASRQNVVAVLGGRRGDTRASRRSPLIGLVLVGVAVALAALGVRRASGMGGGGEVPIALSAVVAVLGMILLAPVAVVALARLAGRLPLPLRFAARDAARHRTRTVPAVAAVAATVAGVVALGISITSDEAENRETYTPRLAMGQASVTDYAQKADWPAYLAAAREVAPESGPTLIRGIPSGGRTYVDFRARFVGQPRSMLSSWGGELATSVVVARDPADVDALGLDAEAAGRARRALAAGQPVVFADRAVPDGPARLTVKQQAPRERRMTTLGQVQVDAVAVPVAQAYAPVQAVLPTSVARRLHAPVADVGVLVPGGLSSAQQQDLSEKVAAISSRAEVYVERGYQADSAVVIIKLILAGLGAVLMLGGTLTATFLALSDAKPDLATLAAVGARPRTRRGVAGGYALVVGLVGSVLGALIGAIPGLAITYPLTDRSGYFSGPVPDGLATHYIDIPWLMIAGVVLGLPLLTALVMAAAARSRLPMVARLQ